MKACIYREFKSNPGIEKVLDPQPQDDGVVIRVKATGLCRSDWHGWMGHDPDIRLPHVPGHEIAGEIAEIGRDVNKFKTGDRVTLPFVCGCGNCPPCLSGNQQVCDNQFQPGFTHWGSFAEYVEVQHADINLVKLPQDLDFESAALLGCRFGTSYRALVDRAKISEENWVAVYGCGGVGLSAIMIGAALGAKVIAIDTQQVKLNLARSIGACETVLVQDSLDVPFAVRNLSGGGAHISMDALGSPVTCRNSILSLRKGGIHLQVGLLPPEGGAPDIPMPDVIGNELSIIGSHGIQAYRYTGIFSLIAENKMNPARLITNRISLEESPGALINMDKFQDTGVTVINKF